MLGGAFLVSPPSLLAGFAAMQVSDGVARHDQRCSGGLGLDIYAFVYYLLLSLVLSKITRSERAQAKHSRLHGFPCCVLCTPGLTGEKRCHLELPALHQLLQELLRPLRCGHPTRDVFAQGAVSGPGRRGSTSQLTTLLGWVMPLRKCAPLPTFPILALRYVPLMHHRYLNLVSLGQEKTSSQS